MIEGPTTSASKLASSLSSYLGTAVVGLISTFSVGVSVGTSSVIDSTLGLFVVLALGSKVFFYAKRCLRKVAPIGVVR